jgi:type IV pilus assembly protein PilN
MIRVNLIAAERRSRPLPALTAEQKIAAGVVAVLLVTLFLVGWRYWSLRQESNRLDVDIAAAQQETARLRSVLQEVQSFEQRKADLQQRATLIERLRQSQSAPVHMLDEISRALPPALWLTQLKQTDDSVVIDGRCLELTGLSDFAANLEASGYFKKAIEIVSSQTEEVPVPPGQVVRFSIKAQFQHPGGGPPS